MFDSRNGRVLHLAIKLERTVGHFTSHLKCNKAPEMWIRCHLNTGCKLRNSADLPSYPLYNSVS